MEFARTAKLLKQLISSDFHEGGGFFPGQHPDPTWREHSRRVLEATLLRTRFTRARRELETLVDDKAMDDLIDALLDFFNGRWWLAKLEHFCFEEDCCHGRNVLVAIERAYALLDEAIYRRLGIRIPAANRWYTFGDVLPQITLGKLLHDTLGRVDAAVPPVVVAGAGGEDGQGDDEQDSYAQLCSKKLKKRHEFTSESGTAMLLARASIVSEAVDALSNREQMLDEAGHALAEFADPNGPVLHCQQFLCSFMLSMVPESNRACRLFRMMFDHFSHSVLACDILESMQQCSTEVSSQVWARFEVFNRQRCDMNCYTALHFIHRISFYYIMIALHATLSLKIFYDL
jgi:hypothetical protein